MTESTRRYICIGAYISIHTHTSPVNIYIKRNLCIHYRVVSLDVGLVLEEEERGVGIFLLARPQQRRLTLLILRWHSLRARAGLQQALGDLEISEREVCHEGRERGRLVGMLEVPLLS